MYTVNTQGVHHIQSWIDCNRLSEGYSLVWAENIASEIDGLDASEELTNNGRYSYEVGMKDWQGRNLVIYLYPEHFDREGNA